MSLPAEKFRWTVERYQRAVQTGFLKPDERFELINGELVAVVPPNPPHARTVRYLNQLLTLSLAGDNFVVCVQDPIDLGPDSHPEPDIAIVRGPEGRYGQRHPGAVDVVLAIEVADTSLRYDRNVKIPLYAKHFVAEVWLLDLNRRSIEVFREPSGNRYQEIHTYTQGIITPTYCPNTQVDVATVFNL